MDAILMVETQPQFFLFKAGGSSDVVMAEHCR